jgi:Ion channel
MYVGAAFNKIYLVAFCIAAMCFALFSQGFIASGLLILVYPFLMYHIFFIVGEHRGDYSRAIPLMLTVFGWIIVVFAVIYSKSGLIYNGQMQSVTFWDGLYFSITTWTTLGYGDFSALPHMRIITSVEALLGYIGMGIFVAIMANWISERVNFRVKMHEHNRNLPLRQQSKSPSNPPDKNA